MAVNVALFPPLYFFSALYYTDLLSLLMVLYTIHAHLLSLQSPHSWGLYTVTHVVAAIAAMFCRQTNVFWVGIFPIGITVVQLLSKTISLPSSSETSVEGTYGYIKANEQL